MKKILTLAFILSLSTSAFAFPWGKPKPKPSPTPATVVVKNGSDSLKEAKNLVKELNAELNSAKETNKNLQLKLNSANKKVEDAELKTQQVQKNADALKAWGIEKQNEAFKWLDKYTAAIKKYHRLKNIAAIVAAAFGAMLGMWCMRLVPPVYAAYAFALPIAGAVLSFGAVWMFL